MTMTQFIISLYRTSVAFREGGRGGEGGINRSPICFYTPHTRSPRPANTPPPHSRFIVVYNEFDDESPWNKILISQDIVTHLAPRGWWRAAAINLLKKGNEDRSKNENKVNIV